MYKKIYLLVRDGYVVDAYCCKKEAEKIAKRWGDKSIQIQSTTLSEKCFENG